MPRLSLARPIPVEIPQTVRYKRQEHYDSNNRYLNKILNLQRRYIIPCLDAQGLAYARHFDRKKYDKNENGKKSILFCKTDTPRMRLFHNTPWPR